MSGVQPSITQTSRTQPWIFKIWKPQNVEDLEVEGSEVEGSEVEDPILENPDLQDLDVEDPNFGAWKSKRCWGY
jgi:hypothetical protein